MSFLSDFFLHQLSTIVYFQNPLLVIFIVLFFLFKLHQPVKLNQTQIVLDLIEDSKSESLIHLQS